MITDVSSENLPTSDNYTASAGVDLLAYRATEADPIAQGVPDAS